ncbi:MAG: hypothetical protein QME79_12915 [Bacillota bacterium]|nr:hypothetical protein [Bacillota bacterium]
MNIEFMPIATKGNAQRRCPRGSITQWSAASAVTPSSRIAIMHHGRVETEGTAQALKDASRRTRRMSRRPG